MRIKVTSTIGPNPISLDMVSIEEYECDDHYTDGDNNLVLTTDVVEGEEGRKRSYTESTVMIRYWTKAQVIER